MNWKTYVMMCGTGNAWPQEGNRGLADFCIVDQPPEERGQTNLSIFKAGADGVVWHIKVDLGEGGLATTYKAGLPPPDLIVLTHGHPDHLNLMQLDHFIRAAQPRRIHLLTSSQTWSMIPAYAQAKLDHLAIAPEQSYQTTLAGDTVEVYAADASSHCGGGLVYRIRAEGFDLGVLFDLRDFRSLSLACWADLDLAVLDGNSLHPLASRTGHASIAEGLAFLSALKRPPRFSLFAHYGSDDDERFTPAELRVLLTAMAPPGVSVGLAYRGMVLSSRCLPPRNPVAILDPATHLVVGVGEKSVVHAQGLLHASVLLLVCLGGRLLLIERHALSAHAGCIDLFGGHTSPADGSLPLATAMREGSEEVRVYVSDLRVAFDPTWLEPLSEPFGLISTATDNHERSSLFGVRLPAGVLVRAFDEIQPGQEVELVVHRMTLNEALALQNERVADGLRRVLVRCREDGAFRAKVERLLTAG